MRVVVTGATGNVGTALVRRLVAEPAVRSVVGLARRRPEWHPPKTTWMAVDVSADDLAGCFAGADVVVHLAWLIQPSHRPLTTWRANVLGTHRVLDAVAEAGVPVFVYASSVGAYSPGPKAGGVDESWPTDGFPTAAYCREKAYVERLLDDFERSYVWCRVVRLRTGFVFQRASAVQQRRLFAGPWLASFMVRPSLVPALPAVTGLRVQALHADDAADAYWKAIGHEVRGAFNIAADPPLDAAELAARWRTRTVPFPRRALRAGVAAAWHLHVTPSSPYLLDAVAHLPVMDTGRARRELGWRPRQSALDAVETLIAGLRNGEGFPTPPLAPMTSGRLRQRELTTGVGEWP